MTDQIVATGVWTDPSSGLQYREELTEEKVREWLEWIPNMLAVINAGVADELIYHIAGACHERHLITNGELDSPRPTPPSSPTTTVPDSDVLATGSIKVVSNAVLGSARTFDWGGNHYSRSRVMGKVFEAPASPALAPQLHDAMLRVESITVGNNGKFKCRVLAQSAAGVATMDMLGQVVPIAFGIVDHLFEKV